VADEPNDLARDRQTNRDVWRGIGLALALHALQIPVAIVTHGDSLYFLAVSQVLYEVPALVIALATHRSNLALGLLIGATFSFVVAFGTCAVWLATAPHY
jgi:hypothetical protein